MPDAAPKSKDPTIISAYLDAEDPDNIGIFLVREEIDADHGYIQAGAVHASDHAGWRIDPGTWLKLSQEEDDVGEHTLLTAAEAQAYLDDKGLKLEDGKAMLLARLVEVNGYAPDILPEDPNLLTRRAEARARRGLPP